MNTIETTETISLTFRWIEKALAAVGITDWKPIANWFVFDRSMVLTDGSNVFGIDDLHNDVWYTPAGLAWFGRCLADNYANLDGSPPPATTVQTFDFNVWLDQYQAQWRDPGNPKPYEGWMPDLKPSGQAKTQPRVVAKPLSTPGPGNRTGTITTASDAEDAIVEYLCTHPDRIAKLIYESIPAPREVVKTALESLIAQGEVRTREKPGRTGVMTVYSLRPENEPAPVPPPPAAAMSLGELAKASGLPKSTVQYQRGKGKTDAEIIDMGGHD